MRAEMRHLAWYQRSSRKILHSSCVAFGTWARSSGWTRCPTPLDPTRLYASKSLPLHLLSHILSGFVPSQLWVGVMISTQPFFIAGVEDPDVAKSSAFGACGIFAFTFVSSILGIWYDSQNKSAATSLTMEDGAESMASSYQLARDNNFPSYGATPVMS